MSMNTTRNGNPSACSDACQLNEQALSSQLLISQQTGQVRPSTDMDGNRVNQALPEASEQSVAFVI
jgi:hypothetical protein